MSLPFHAIPATDVLKSFESSSSGLSSNEAAQRLKNVASWEVAPPKSKGILALLWRQIANPFSLLLFGAIGVSVWTGEWLDAGVTLAIVIANIMIGFFQEFHADREFFALQNYLPKEVTVRRDGKTITISANFLVPGDIVLLNAGKNVVCDGRILNAAECTMLEAALSGESAPVAKNAEQCNTDAGIFERTNMVFAGTSVASGQATVLVTALGTQTEFGKIGTMTSTITDRTTPLEEEMMRLSVVLTKGILILAIIVLAVAMIRGQSAVSALALAAALAIAAIPEGLSMTLIVVLSVAMRRMFRKGVLVRHLTATETLGCIDVLCADKTGTLTTGEMAIVEVRASDASILGDEIIHHDIWKALSCFAQHHHDAGSETFAGSATAGAVRQFVQEKMCLKGAEETCTLGPSITANIPFSATYKFSACIPQGGSDVFIMGAPEALFSRSALTSEQRRDLEKTVTTMASQGQRVIAVGRCERKTGALSVDNVTNGEIIGFIGIEDPLRASVPQAIIGAHKAGIRTVMITGDHPETARHIASKAFGTKDVVVMLGADFAARTVDERIKTVQSVDVFARMLPEHKMLVIDAFHSLGLRVGMTGDGVNDAPALKAADVGIAVGHSTEVAKEASDIVLLSGDFSCIIAAIAEGRTVFTNARNVTIFYLGLGLGETIAILGSFFLGLPPVLSPLLLLWLNVITDGIPGMFFAFERGDTHAMSEPPRQSKSGLMSADVQKLLVFSTVTFSIILGIFLFLFRNEYSSIATMHSVIYCFIGSLGMSFMFVTRSLRVSFWKNIFTKTPLWFGVFLGLPVFLAPFFIPAMRTAFELTPPSLLTVALIIVAVFCVLIPIDIAKRKLR